MIDHLAQAVTEQDSGCGWRLPVSGKPDVVFEVVERDAAEGLRLMEAGAVTGRCRSCRTPPPRRRATSTAW